MLDDSICYYFKYFKIWGAFWLGRLISGKVNLILLISKFFYLETYTIGENYDVDDSNRQRQIVEIIAFVITVS